MLKTARGDIQVRRSLFLLACHYKAFAKRFLIINYNKSNKAYWDVPPPPHATQFSICHLFCQWHPHFFSGTTLSLSVRVSWVELAHAMLKEWAFDPGNSEYHVSLASLMAHGCSSPGNAIVESSSMAIITTCRENPV